MDVVALFRAATTAAVGIWPRLPDRLNVLCSSPRVSLAIGPMLGSGHAARQQCGDYDRVSETTHSPPMD
jgi:hypothetical protein